VVAANFSAAPVTGSDTLTVTFTDSSLGAGAGYPLTWSWSFRRRRRFSGAEPHTPFLFNTQYVYFQAHRDRQWRVGFHEKDHKRLPLCRSRPY